MKDQGETNYVGVSFDTTRLKGEWDKLPKVNIRLFDFTSPNLPSEVRIICDMRCPVCGEHFTYDMVKMTVCAPQEQKGE